jgi:hypothetical protein
MKKCNSLCDLRDEIKKKGKEKIIEFVGHTLTTDKNIYTLYDNVVYINGVASK